jgi:hypothetical protein
MKLHRLVGDSGPIGWCHYCPGCRHTHCFNVEQPTRAWPEFNIAGGVKWSFNGNLERPSFSPSMLIQTGGWKSPEGKDIPQRTLCHYVLSDGVINFCADSAHELTGRAVPLADYPQRYLEPASAPVREKGAKRVKATAARKPAPVAPAMPRPPAVEPEPLPPFRHRRD